MFFHFHTVPTAAPEIVNLFSTPTSITVTWKSVDAEHQNGVLTETVACIDQEADNIDARCDEVEQDRTSYTFHNLHPGLEYLVRLAAKTDVGQGPFSEPLPRMTPSKTNCTGRFFLGGGRGIFPPQYLNFSMSDFQALSDYFQVLQQGSLKESGQKVRC